MNEILSSKYYRRLFFSLLFILLIVIFLTRLFVFKYFDSSLDISFLALVSLVFNGLISSFIVTVAIGSFIFFATPAIFKKSKMEVISAKEISILFRRSVVDTKSWIIKGACGRFTRDNTLHAMVREAKIRSIGRSIRILLIDPNNERICSEYAIYRKSLSSASKETVAPWSTKKVQEEVISSILVALSVKNDEPILRVDIFLLNHFSAFRLDISDHHVIITKEDRQATALRADSGTYFYDSYIDEVSLHERQSKAIIPKSNVVINASTNKDMIEKYISDNDIVNDPSILGSLDFESILSKVKKSLEGKLNAL
ncbi:hypothetical protein ACMU9X_001349 [Yersinia enterocolitica]|nr:hypothetical protein [Yersinia enterocolitica]